MQRRPPSSLAWLGVAGLALAASLGVAACRTAGPTPIIRPITGEQPTKSAEEAAVEPLEPLPVTRAPVTDRVEEVPVELVLRVGLATDRNEVSFQHVEGLSASWSDGRLAIGRELVVTPAPSSVSMPVYRLQVAALKDPGQAERLAERLESGTGQPADVVLEAERGLHRVRVGRYASREEAELAQRADRTFGLRDAWIATEKGVIEEPALLLRQGEQAVKVQGRWVAVGRADGTTSFDEGRYRGRILLFLNDRGALNVINELSLESYLRGVVPVEMGPEAYPEVEALKAQTVAARTYAVRNLREFEDEGFDICATPRCQVYGGLEVEHPRSDRAVAETAGEILLWDDGPIDALYTATCGGHTEEVDLIFPTRPAEAYLTAAPCLEGGNLAVATGGRRGVSYPGGLARGLAPGGSASSPELRSRFEALGASAGLAGPESVPELASTEWSDVREFLVKRFDLVLSPTPAAGSRLAMLWAELDERGLDAPLGQGDAERLVLFLAERLNVIWFDQVRFLGTRDGDLRVRGAAGEEQVRLAPGVESFARHGDRFVTADLSLAPGDPLELVRRGRNVIGVVQTIDLAGAGPSVGAETWTRFRSDRKLRAQVATRYPGFELSTFEVLERGASGRVGAIRLIDHDGHTEVVEGLAVRWILDVPDTKFDARRGTSSSGASGWSFTGRGRGHGVGMCQIGSFSMAIRGHDYRSILSYYYAGTELQRVDARRQTVRQTTASTRPVTTAVASEL